MQLMWFLILLSFNVDGQPSEYTMKATFIGKFPQFIEWGARSDVNDVSKPFVISIIGNNPFKNDVVELLKRQKIKNKKVEMRFINQITQIENTDILFISNSMRKNLSKILEYTQNKPILTISDTSGFAEKGVHINFYLENDNVRFEINEQAARNAGIIINYRLLANAKIVKTE